MPDRNLSRFLICFYVFTSHIIIYNRYNKQVLLNMMIREVALNIPDYIYIYIYVYSFIYALRKHIAHNEASVPPLDIPAYLSVLSKPKTINAIY